MGYDNKQMAKRVFDEFWSKGNLAVIDELFDPSYEDYDPLEGKLDREGLKRSCQAYRVAFPDLTFQIHDLIGEGDKVVVRWTAVGTHKGPLMGAKATGKRPSISGITVTEFRNGRCFRAWSEWDSLHLLQEVGVLPIPKLTEGTTQKEVRS